MYYGVLVEISNLAVNKLFYYKASENLKGKIQIGSRVKVEFGTRLIQGLVLNIKKNIDFDTSKLKYIREVIDKESILTKELLLLGRFIERRYLCSLMGAYQLMLPPELKFGKNFKNREYTYYRLKEIPIKSTKSEQKIIDFLQTNGDDQLIGFSSIRKRLVNKGVIESYSLPYLLKKSPIYSKEIVLNENQKEVFNYIINTNYQNILLYGVTGSGKTLVYLELIKYYLSQGKKAILLVPEISLTFQMKEFFEYYLQENVVVLSSSVSNRDRYDAYKQLKAGRYSVLIGSRSAVFAPIDELGIIIIDEEHSSSFKQTDMGARYKTCEIAQYRAKYHNAKLVYGSATPSIELFYLSMNNEIGYCELLNKYNDLKQNLQIIDLKTKKSSYHLAKESIQIIKDELNKGYQALLLLNRKGYGNYAICSNCGEIKMCKNCDISLTYYKSVNELRCNTCEYHEKFDKCKCGTNLRVIGAGTEKIEEELIQLFKDYRILRIDRDNSINKGILEKNIIDFKNHKYDILIGTQIISKGFNFLNVTVSCVINADGSLSLQTYEAAFDTYALLEQTAGRSGRGIANGTVLIQTYNPEHYVISSINKSYKTFYDKEIMMRKQLNYPPFVELITLCLKSKNKDIVIKEMKKIEKFLKRFDFLELLGPNYNTVFKKSNIYELKVILKVDKNNEKISEILKFIKEILRNKTLLNFYFDRSENYKLNS